MQQVQGQVQDGRLQEWGSPEQAWQPHWHNGSLEISRGKAMIHVLSPSWRGNRRGDHPTGGADV